VLLGLAHLFLRRGQARPRPFMGRLGAVQAVLGDDPLLGQTAHALQVRLGITHGSFLFPQIGTDGFQAGAMLTQHLVCTVALHFEQDFGAPVGALFRL
jgi:hypothetical protein